MVLPCPWQLPEQTQPAQLGNVFTESCDLPFLSLSQIQFGQ